MSEDVWSEQDTNPDAIEAALRSLLFRRHAENEALVPARVLNLVVIVDREWKGEIANRLERVGRYQASRTILCAVEERRTRMDAVATVSYEEPGHGTLGVVREHVEIDLGPEHLEALQTVIDPVLAAGMPTIVWSPHGHDEAVQSILSLIDVILLDSDDLPDPVDAFARARDRCGDAYIVDLAWLRTTPWRERLAASFDLPRRRPSLERVGELQVRYREQSTASSLLLAGWLASRLHWERSPLAYEGGGVLRGSLRREGGEVEVSMETIDQEAPGLGGVTVGLRAWDVALPATRCRRPRRGRVPRGRNKARVEDPRRLARRGRDPWRGRQTGAATRSHLRAGTRRRAGALPRVTMSLEVVEEPAQAAAAMMVSASLGGGQIVLAGGSTPRTANERFVDAVKAVGLNLSGTTFWVGDERCVGPDDDLANFTMIKESLIDPLADVVAVDVRRIKGELGPEAGADEYEEQLRDAGTPTFDLVMLGLGPDGHTASLFPDQRSLAERDRLMVGVPEAGLEPFVARVTMTLAALTAGKQVVVLAEGDSKADAIAAAFGPDAKPDPHVPASMLVPEAEELIVLMDRAAATKVAPS